MTFDKFNTEIDLRYQAVGAAPGNSCLVNAALNGYPYYSMFAPAVFNLNAGYLPRGQYSWVVTCTSSQGSQTTVTATGRVRREVGVEWLANTSSTNGSWLSIPHAGIVSWDVDGTFDQISRSTQADYCQVHTYGYHGNPNYDPETQGTVSAGQPTYYCQTQSPIWKSDEYFPTYFQFATFMFGDPQNSPYGLAPFDGYKWRLTCRNSDDMKQIVMYGKMTPAGNQQALSCPIQ